MVSSWVVSCACACACAVVRVRVRVVSLVVSCTCKHAQLGRERDEFVSAQIQTAKRGHVADLRRKNCQLVG